MNIFDEIFKKKWDSSKSSSSSQSLQIKEISLYQRTVQTRKSTADKVANKGSSSASSTPKRPVRLDEPDVVLRRRNPAIVSQNVATKKASRPISYQHVPNKALPNEKQSNFKIKQATSIPSLLEDANEELRPASAKIRGKTVKEQHHHHHHHHHSTSHDPATPTSGNPGNSTLSSAASGGGGVGGGGTAPTPLPRTASASANLNVLAGGVAKASVGASGREGAGKSARGKGGGSGSRERLVDGAGVGDASRKGDRPVSGEAIVELEQMQRQLQDMAAEKSALVLQLEERLEQVSDLQNEIKVLKIYQEQSAHQLDQKTEENSYLRSKLRDVVHSPLSDSEKQQLLLIDTHRHHSSAPASIAVNVPNETGDATACTTPEWDKHSSSNVSDVSVACLQDKINQMQETHYSTNEELQATLQELTDLQRQLTELQVHNNRLGDEKNLMFDSLCRQTDRLKETRSELDNLKQLLSTNHDSSDTDNTQKYAEREAQLLEIVQRLEVERDNFRDRQQEIIQEVQQLRISNEQGEEERARLIERMRMLEGSIDAKVAENRQTEQELGQVRDDCSGSKIEIDRLKDILESARAKIVELKQDRDLSDKSELDELLDAARKEKDTLELEITHLREQVARSRNEIEKLREQVSILQEECKVTRNNAKCTQSELDYKVETLMSDKTNLIEQLQRSQGAVDDFEDQNLCLNEDKRQLNGVLSETQRNLCEAEGKLVAVMEELGELKKLRENENEEWEKFQNDLLTSVRVANDFKTEAQLDLQKIVLENKGYREKIRQLEMQIEKLKGGALESSLVRSSIRRSIHVTPRKLDLLPQKIAEVQNRDSTNIKTKTKEAKMAEIQDGFQNKLDDSSNELSDKKKVAIKLKDHKNSKFIVPENKMGAKIQDGDLIPDDILSDSLQQVNTTISEFKIKSGKQTKNSTQHERSLSNFEASATSKIQDVADLPRKKFEISDATVYTGILIKPVTKNAKTKTKPSVRTAKSLEKLLTEADEEKFRILGEMLAHIDHSVPVYLLSEDDRSLLKLKAFYDTRDMYRHKPIAKKPKDELCISNPLLNSVFANPALKKIAEDPKLPTVEPITPQLELKESFSFARKRSKRYCLESATMLEDGLPERQHKTIYSTFKPNLNLNKSQSVSNLCDRTYLTDSDEEASLKRYLTEEDLSRNFVIAPSDSKLSLNLWKGTYTFSKQPKHRRDSESSCDSELHVYTVNEDINKSNSFIYESPQVSLERKKREIEQMAPLDCKKSVGDLSKLSLDTSKMLKNRHDSSSGNLESSGRFRRFVGPIFGSKENLGAIHEARNSIIAPKPEVISFEADVHHSHNTLERPTSSIVYYEIQKDVQNNDFDRRKSLEETSTKFVDDISENLHRQKDFVELDVQINRDLDNSSSAGSKFEVQEKNLYLDFEDASPLSEFTASSSKSDKLYVVDIEIPTEKHFQIEEMPPIRKTTDSLRKQRALAESLSRRNFTEEEIRLVQKVVETTEDSQSRPQSDINNDDIIVIEWIDYCDQCKEVGTIALSLQEYSREIKSGRSISELDNVTRRSTELNEQESSPKSEESQQVLATKENKKKFLNAEASAGFLDPENMELFQNFANESSKKRASIKLDTLERKYSLKDDLDLLPLEVSFRKSPNTKAPSKITRSSSEIDEINRDSKEFYYVEGILNSWKFKTRKKMRKSIESAGFDLHGPIPFGMSDFRSLDNIEPIYQNVTRSKDSLPMKQLFPPNTKAPKALPRPSQSDDPLTGASIKSTSVKMTDKSQPKNDNDSDSEDENQLRLTRPKYADTMFTLPTLEAPTPPSLDDVNKGPEKASKTDKLAAAKLVDYPTLEQVAVSHVLNNNLPMFGKLNERIGKDESSYGEANDAKEASVNQRTKFEIRSLRKDSADNADNRDSFVRARNRFLQAEADDKISSRSASPRSSFHKIKPASD